MEKRCCENCVYATPLCGRWLRIIMWGWAGLRICFNSADNPGRLQEVYPTGYCRNFCPRRDDRRRPRQPGRSPNPSRQSAETRIIPLMHGLYAIVDAADYEWLSQHKWACSPSGYAARQENGRTIFMHRQILNAPAGMVVDHIDNSRHNNCRSNLRLCTRRQNLQHLVKHHNCTSRFKGVRYCQQRHKWHARAEFEGECFWLGSFDDEIEAARAYDRLAVELFGEFAYLNFPEEWPLERRQEAYAKKETMQAVRAAKAERMKRRKGKRKERGEASGARGERSEWVPKRDLSRLGSRSARRLAKHSEPSLPNP